MSDRPTRPPQQHHRWVVEIWSNAQSEWFLALARGGCEAVFFSLATAREFRRELREHRRSNGRREFPTVRVRRAVVRSYGCAV